MISLFTAVLLLSGCSFNVDVIEMATQPTNQLFDLTDSEGDGVISARDLCPISLSGAAVNNRGCATDKVEKVRIQLLVNFASGSAQVGTEYYAEIKSLADLMKENPTITVKIEGHTSIIGDANYNKKLSLRRAEAVKALLVKQYNIKASRVEASGFGFEELLYEGNDEYVNAHNRRIVAEINGAKDIVDMKWTIYSVDHSDQ